MMGSDGNGTMIMDDPPLATTMPNPDIIQPLPVMPANTTDEGDDDGSRLVTVAVPGGGILDLTLTESTITIPGFPAITVPSFGGFPSFRFPARPTSRCPSSRSSTPSSPAPSPRTPEARAPRPRRPPSLTAAAGALSFSSEFLFSIPFSIQKKK